MALSRRAARESLMAPLLRPRPRRVKQPAVGASVIMLATADRPRVEWRTNWGIVMAQRSGIFSWGVVCCVATVLAAAPVAGALAASPQQHAATSAATALRHSEELPPVLGPLTTSEKQGYG